MAGEINKQLGSAEGARATTAPAMSSMALRVGVFCSANELSQQFTDPAEELVGSLARNGHTLVWGGSDMGLMKNIASAAQAEGGEIIGVTTDSMQKYARESADRMIITETLSERREVLLENSDVLTGLVGGTGTLDEITDVIEHKKIHHHNKPIVVLNTDNFYKGFRQQIQRMHDEGMLKHPLDYFVHFANTPAEALEYIEQFASSQAEAQSTT